MTPAHGLRLTCLAQVFERIASTRMAGVPVLNPALQVQPVGFLPGDEAHAETVALVGILITPWFMNLVRLPVRCVPMAQAALSPGAKAVRLVGAEHFEFIGAHEEELGAFEVCSLFSPMFEFADQASAVATAVEVLAMLRKPVAAAPTPPTLPSRRGFLLGRPNAVARP